MLLKYHMLIYIHKNVIDISKKKVYYYIVQIVVRCINAGILLP